MGKKAWNSFLQHFTPVENVNFAPAESEFRPWNASTIN